MGFLRPGLSSVYHWTHGNSGNVVASIELHAEAEGLHLSYCVHIGGGRWKDVAEVIPIARVPCRFGGTRPYFICKGFRAGKECQRRVAKLYLSNRYFLCRHCSQLTYTSQWEQPWERALRRANKLRQRLGIDNLMAGAPPEMPKGISVRVYARLLEEALQAEILADAALLNRIRWMAQIKNDLK
jgi:hypothetical protein